jgi:hypothetical protein
LAESKFADLNPSKATSVDCEPTAVADIDNSFSKFLISLYRASMKNLSFCYSFYPLYTHTQF